MTTLDAQLAEVRREIALRKAVYPKWVAAGRLKAATASRLIETMEAVQETLEQYRREQEELFGPGA